MISNKTPIVEPNLTNIQQNNTLQKTQTKPVFLSFKKTSGAYLFTKNSPISSFGNIGGAPANGGFFALSKKTGLFDKNVSIIASVYNPIFAKSLG